MGSNDAGEMCYKVLDWITGWKDSRSSSVAQKTIVTLVDDLDGTSSDRIETVDFGLDGVTYQIDLNDDNAGKLRDHLADRKSVV